MRRGLVVGVQIAVLLLAGASPALSHATFPGQGPLAAQADQTLNMAVPEERDPDTHNVGVTVALPVGWTAVHCQATAPWQCTLTPGQIQWTKVPATAPPGPDDVAFVFTVHTGGPGNYPIPVIQTYSPPTNEVVRWIGPPNSDYPGPHPDRECPRSFAPRGTVARPVDTCGASEATPRFGTASGGPGASQSPPHGVDGTPRRHRLQPAGRRGTRPQPVQPIAFDNAHSYRNCQLLTVAHHDSHQRTR